MKSGANDECLAEHFIRNANGGAVAVIAATRNTWTGYNEFLMFGMHKATWPSYVPNPPINGYPAIPSTDSNPLPGIGQIMNFGKLYMCRAYSSDTNRNLELEMYHVFGDPEMPIWTSAPAGLGASFPEGIGAVGEQHFVVNVTNSTTNAPVPARVALTRGSTLYSVQEKDAGGIARFKLNNVGTGDLDLTVSSTGYRPLFKTIRVSASGATLNRLEPDNGVLNQSGMSVASISMAAFLPPLRQRRVASVRLETSCISLFPPPTNSAPLTSWLKARVPAATGRSHWPPRFLWLIGI